MPFQEMMLDILLTLFHPKNLKPLKVQLSLMLLMLKKLLLELHLQVDSTFIIKQMKMFAPDSVIEGYRIGAKENDSLNVLFQIVMVYQLIVLHAL